MAFAADAPPLRGRFLLTQILLWDCHPGVEFATRVPLILFANLGQFDKFRPTCFRFANKGDVLWQGPQESLAT